MAARLAGPLRLTRREGLPQAPLMLDDTRFGLDRKARLAGPFPLDGGVALSGIEIAYET